jgi:hypothetical protein
VSRTECCHPTETSHASSIKSIAGSAIAKKKRRGEEEKKERGRRIRYHVGPEEKLSQNRKGCRQIIDCGGNRLRSADA